MKKLVLILALAIGVPVVSTTTSVLIAQTCDPDSPCLYSGRACPADRISWDDLTITVKLDKNGNWVAEVKNKGTYYVFESRSAADQKYGNYYVSVDGRKYYFNM